MSLPVVRGNKGVREDARVTKKRRTSPSLSSSCLSASRPRVSLAVFFSSFFIFKTHERSPTKEGGKAKRKERQRGGEPVPQTKGNGKGRQGNNTLLHEREWFTLSCLQSRSSQSDLSCEGETKEGLLSCRRCCCSPHLASSSLSSCVCASLPRVSVVTADQERRGRRKRGVKKGFISQKKSSRLATLLVPHLLSHTHAHAVPPLVWLHSLPLSLHPLDSFTIFSLSFSLLP